MDKDIEILIKKLSLALSKAFSNSKEVKEIVKQIKEKDYDIFLLLEAKIGLSKKDFEDYLNEDFIEESAEEKEDILDINISPEDREFLRSIRIKIDQED